MKILDIDLDFFLDRTVTNKSTFSNERLDSKYYKPWPQNMVIKFLEENCGLKDKEIDGYYFIHHHEVFYFLKEKLEKGQTAVIDHIDAHADLGLGDISYRIISCDLLKHPVKDRSNYIKDTGKEKDLSSGNYLAYAIACGWISQLNYIHPKNRGNDLSIFHFKDFDPNINIIQMKYVSSSDIDYFINRDISVARNTIKPYRLEKEVIFHRIPSNVFRSKYDYDYILLTQSPGFTPKEADKLIPLIKKYMNLK